MLFSLLIPLGTRPTAEAHDVLGTYVQHAVHLRVGAQHMDVTVDLTFFEEWSAREREIMDTDSNGIVTRLELQSYLKKLAPQVSKQLKLRVAGRELPLVPLYDPEIDLLGNSKVGPAHHRFRLFFFAPTPTSLAAEDEIVVEDHLWPDAKAIRTSQAEGRDGCAVAARTSSEQHSELAQPTSPRSFIFRCLSPPALKSAGRNGSGNNSTNAQSQPSQSPQPPQPSTTRPVQ